VQVLWAQYPFDVINRIGGRAERAAREHNELLKNVIEGDAAGAMLTMRQHIETGWNELRKSLPAKTENTVKSRKSEDKSSERETL
jgi:DNA-binding GntR family transcriptional regulator